MPIERKKMHLVSNEASLAFLVSLGWTGSTVACDYSDSSIIEQIDCNSTLCDVFALGYFGLSGDKPAKKQEYSHVPHDMPVFLLVHLNY